MSSRQLAKTWGASGTGSSAWGVLWTKAAKYPFQFDNRFYTKYNVTCIDFVRSSPAPRQNCALGPRDQVIDYQDQDHYHDDLVWAGEPDHLLPGRVQPIWEQRRRAAQAETALKRETPLHWLAYQVVSQCQHVRLTALSWWHSMILEMMQIMAMLVINIATGETSQAITPFHFFDKFNFHH